MPRRQPTHSTGVGLTGVGLLRCRHLWLPKVQDLRQTLMCGRSQEAEPGSATGCCAVILPPRHYHPESMQPLLPPCWRLFSCWQASATLPPAHYPARQSLLSVWRSAVMADFHGAVTAATAAMAPERLTPGKRVTSRSSGRCEGAERFGGARCCRRASRRGLRPPRAACPTCGRRDQHAIQET